MESNFLAHFADLRLDICRGRGCRYFRPQSDNDNPAASKVGASLRLEGCFRCDMIQFSVNFTISAVKMFSGLSVIPVTSLPTTHDKSA